MKSTKNRIPRKLKKQQKKHWLQPQSIDWMFDLLLFGEARIKIK